SNASFQPSARTVTPMISIAASGRGEHSPSGGAATASAAFDRKDRSKARMRIPPPQTDKATGLLYQAAMKRDLRPSLKFDPMPHGHAEASAAGRSRLIEIHPFDDLHRFDRVPAFTGGIGADIFLRQEIEPLDQDFSHRPLSQPHVDVILNAGLEHFEVEGVGVAEIDHLFTDKYGEKLVSGQFRDREPGAPDLLPVHHEGKPAEEVAGDHA